MMNNFVFIFRFSKFAEHISHAKQLQHTSLLFIQHICETQLSQISQQLIFLQCPSQYLLFDCAKQLLHTNTLLLLTFHIEGEILPISPSANIGIDDFTNSQQITRLHTSFNALFLFNFCIGFTTKTSSTVLIVLVSKPYIHIAFQLSHQHSNDRHRIFPNTLTPERLPIQTFSNLQYFALKIPPVETTNSRNLTYHLSHTIFICISTVRKPVSASTRTIVLAFNFLDA